MKVKELIEILNQYDLEKEIMIQQDDTDMFESIVAIKDQLVAPLTDESDIYSCVALCHTHPSTPNNPTT